jgi:hypothetical protein
MGTGVEQVGKTYSHLLPDSLEPGERQSGWLPGATAERVWRPEIRRLTFDRGLAGLPSLRPT